MPDTNIQMDSLTALLIEDEPEDAFLTRQAIIRTAEGAISVEHAETLSTGLERLDEGGIDVILLDLSLPDSRGLDTVNKVLSAIDLVPVIVLSGLEDEVLAIQAVGNGAQDYLVKNDANGNSLVRSIRYSVERMRLRAALQESHLLIRHLSDILYIYDFTTENIVQANRQFVEALGMAPQRFDAVNGMRLRDCFDYPKGQDPPPSRGQCASWKDGEVLEFETCIHTSGRAPRWLLCRESVYAREPSGKPELIVGRALDVSSYKRKEQELRQANDELSRKLAGLEAGVGPS